MSEKNEEISKQAEEIIKDGEQITEKIAQLVLSTLKASGEGLSQLGKIVEQVINAAIEQVDKSVPEDSESTLREVYSGVTQATEKAAQSLKLTFDEAKTKSQSFTEDEVKKVVSDLSALESLLIETFQSAANNSRTELTAILEKISAHMQNAMKDVSPAIETALNAAKDHPTKLMKETTGAATELSKNVTGGFLNALADMLESGAESLRASSGSDVEDKKE